MHTPAYPADAEILNTDDLAKLLDCDKETAARRIISGDLPGTKFGRDWIIPRQALIERINEKARQEAAERRAAIEAERDQAQLRGRAVAEPSPLLPTSEQTPKRGQRRKPPTLPSLPLGAAC